MLRNCPKALIRHPAMSTLLARRNLAVGMLRKYCEDVLREWATGTGTTSESSPHTSSVSTPRGLLSPTGHPPLVPSTPTAEPPISSGAGARVVPPPSPMYNLQQPILRLNPIQYAVESDRVGDLRTTFDLFDRDGACVCLLVCGWVCVCVCVCVRLCAVQACVASTVCGWGGRKCVSVQEEWDVEWGVADPVVVFLWCYQLMGVCDGVARGRAIRAGSGSIEFQELDGMMKLLGVPLPESELKAVFQRIDVSGFGAIRFDDFSRYVACWRTLFP